MAKELYLVTIVDTSTDNGDTIGVFESMICALDCAWCAISDKLIDIENGNHMFSSISARMQFNVMDGHKYSIKFDNYRYIYADVKPIEFIPNE